MAPPSSREPQRIAKLLARAGVASRREIERMIAEGRIALDGTPLDTPATLLESLHGVTVDGNPVAAPAPARLFRYHKPAGLLTTERDPGGRPTIYDRLPRGLPRLVPVGRLDLNTEGLLLLTTDGALKRQLELPASGVERSYRARAYGQVSQAQLEDLIDGVEIEGVRYGSIDANLERRTGANVWIELTLTEGKNREVRRVLEHLGLRVSRLIRTRYGPFHLGDLEAGDVDEIRQHDLVTFRTVLAKPGGGKAASNLQFAIRARAEAPPVKKPVDAPTEARVPDSPRPRKSDRQGIFTPRVTPPRSVGEPDVPGIGKPARAARARAHRETTGRPEHPATKPAGAENRVGRRGAKPSRAGDTDRPERFKGKRERPTAPPERTDRTGQPDRLAAKSGRTDNSGRPERATAKPPRAERKPGPVSRADREAEDRAAFVDRPKKRYRPGDRRPRRPGPAKPRAPK